ncbi:hypothetical protein [Flavobacterium anhuiense]|uniref:hypothetical protein n=1 Tax=Flavobacterium anhuiense TaxID=459526 RepID=UPI003D970705
MIELVFVFLAKIYIFFYKEKNDYWKIFPIIIMSTIVIVNIEIISFHFFSLNKYYFGLCFIFLLILFNILLRKRDYNWVVQYSIRRREKIIIIVIFVVDFIILGILLKEAKNAYLHSL